MKWDWVWIWIIFIWKIFMAVCITWLVFSGVYDFGYQKGRMSVYQKAIENDWGEWRAEPDTGDVYFHWAERPKKVNPAKRG